MARSRGEGTIVQRSDGRYQASLQVNGKRRAVYGRTRAEVRQKLKELRAWAERQGELPDNAKRTVGDLLDAWLALCAPDKRPSTLRDYTVIAEQYIRPSLGRLRLEKLRPHHIQNVLTALQAQDKRRTALKVYTYLHRACGLATLWGWLPSNPCDRVLRPSYRSKRKDMWTSAQLGAFLEGTQGHWLHPLWVLAIASGCRLGELLALEWSDVDFGAGTIAIRRTLQRIGGQWVFSEPKTRASQRTISLPADVMASLRRHKVSQAEKRLKAGAWECPELVFTGERGQPLCASVVQHAMKRECRRLGIPELTPHGLRHLHASLLLERGLSLAQVSKRLGHANPGITATVYSHAIEPSDKVAAEAISKVMRGAR